MATQKKVTKTIKKVSPKKKKTPLKKTSTTKKKATNTKKTIKKPVKTKTATKKKISKTPNKRVVKKKVVKTTKKKKVAKSTPEKKIVKKVAKTKNSTNTIKKPVKKKKVTVKIIDGNDLNFNNTINTSQDTDKTIKDFSSKLKTIKVNLENNKDLISKNNPIKQDENIFAENNNNQEEEKINKSFFKFRSFNLYRRIALSFILLTVILLVSVFYFSFSSVSITLTPKIEHISDNLILDVYSDKRKHNSEYAIKGVVERTEVKLEKSYKSTGAEIISEDIVGEVTIINNYNKDQPLIKSTRLLSSEGILYRIKDTVNVPAGGSVKVGIYTDDPGRDKQLNPTEFTIPGLWAGLQDKIYAKNDEPIIYKVKSETYIQQSDMKNAINDIKISVIKKAEEKFNSKNSKNIVVYRIKNDSVLVKSEAEVGDKKENFKVNGSVIVEVVAFGSNKVRDLAEKKLLISIPNDKILSRFNEKSTKYSLNNFNNQEKTASVKVSFSGNIKYKSGANIIDKNAIVGLTKDQLEGYLQGLDSFSDFKIEFFPSFIKKVPNLIDKIKINIK